MGVKELHMTPLLYMFKLLGGLPYTWKHVNAEFRKSSDEAPLGELQRHNGWFIWSVIFGVGRLGLFVYETKSVVKILDECATTAVIILGIEDIFGLLSTILIGYHMIRKSASLAGALASMQSLCLKYGFEATSYCSDKKVIAIVVHVIIGFSFITYGNVGLAMETEWTIEYQSAIIDASINPVLLSLAMIMYSRILDLQGQAYTDFLKILSDRKEEEEQEDGLDAWALTVKMPGGVKPPTPKKKPPKDPLRGFHLSRAKMFILELYDNVQKVKEYFSFMVAVTLLHSMISSIVSCFVSVITPHPSPNYWVATVGNLIIKLFPVFFITDVPRTLNGAVSAAPPGGLEGHCHVHSILLHALYHWTGQARDVY